MGHRRAVAPAAICTLMVSALMVSALFVVVAPAQTIARAKSPTTPPSAVPTRPACLAGNDVAAWPLERQAGHVLMVGLGISRSEAAARLVRTSDLGGILIRGVPGADTAKRLTAISNAGREAPLIAVDEEGGRVQHLRGIVGSMPSARTMAKTMTPGQVSAMARRHGQRMRALGFTMVLAPVLDLQGPANNGIGDRAFSADPAVVARYGEAFSLGFAQAGVTPVLKHFPGHGNASGDSHYAGVTTPALSELRLRDIPPFASVIGAVPVGVMTAHLSVPGADGLPASVSPAITDRVLRKELGFQGLVVTDSLSMHPIRYHWDRAKAAQLALAAGADVLLYDDLPDVTDIVDGLVAAAGADPVMARRLIESNLRILAVKGRLCAGVTPQSAMAGLAAAAPSVSGVTSAVTSTPPPTPSTIG